MGGLFGPSIVYLFELKTFLFLGILVAVVAVPTFLLIPSPETIKHQSKEESPKAEQSHTKTRAVPRSV